MWLLKTRVLLQLGVVSDDFSAVELNLFVTAVTFIVVVTIGHVSVCITCILNTFPFINQQSQPCLLYYYYYYFFSFCWSVPSLLRCRGLLMVKAFRTSKTQFTWWLGLMSRCALLCDCVWPKQSPQTHCYSQRLHYRPLFIEGAGTH